MMILVTIFKQERGSNKDILSLCDSFQHSGLVVDMLAVMINREKEDGQVSRLTPHLVDGGVSILQYADDTLIFLEHELE
jgi:hypothetical protein